MLRTSFRRAFFVLIFCLITFGSSVAFGQVGTTSIRGTVTDKSGGAIVGAKVALTNAAQGLTRTTTTNDTGAYVFTAIPPGTYSLTIEAAGFRKF
jgi:protocatechuate 3,4-dioxygenase beta subunit